MAKRNLRPLLFLCLATCLFATFRTIDSACVPDSISTATFSGPASTLYPNGVLAPNGKVLFLFGRTTDGVNTADVRVFNPATNSWEANLVTTSSVPTPRYASCTATSPDGTKFAVFGGNNGVRTNEFFVLDLNTNVWTKYDADLIPGRTLCALTYTENSIVLFGGRGNAEMNLADVWKFNLATSTWSQTTPSGVAPFGRSGASAFYSNGIAYFFGGINYVSNSRNNELLRLDVNANAWLTTTTATGVTGRYLVAADKLNGNYYVLGGGTDAAGTVGSNFVYNIATGTWQAAPNDLPAPREGGVAVAVPAQNALYVWGSSNYETGVVKYSVGTALTCPTATTTTTPSTTTTSSGSCELSPETSEVYQIIRRNPKAALSGNGVVSSDGKVLFLFGRNGTGLTSDIRVFNPATNKWQGTLATTGAVPSGRFQSCSAVSTDGQKLFVFGGFSNGDVTNDFFSLDLPTRVWTKIPSDVVPARTLCTLVANSTSLILFGGRSTDDEQPNLSDLWKFNLTSGQWLRINPCGPIPRGRFGHSAALSEDALMLVFGGAMDTDTEKTYLNELVKYDVSTNTWFSPNIVPRVAPRYLHSSVYVNGVYYFFGGDIGSPVYASTSVAKYSLTGDQWFTATNLPVSIEGAVAVLADQSTVYIWGGELGGCFDSTDLLKVNLAPYLPPAECAEETAIEDTEVTDFSSVSEEPTVPGTTSPSDNCGSKTPSSLVTLTNNVPNALLYPSGSTLPDGRILFMFGHTSGSVNTADLRIFDPATESWTGTLATTGTVPPARYASCSATSPDGTKVAVFGGIDSVRSNDLYILDITSKVWTKYTAPAALAARTLCGLAFGDSSLTLFGGRGSAVANLDDLWSFSLATSTWRQVTPTGVAPAGRSGLTGFYANGIAHFFGGVNYGASSSRTYFNDLLRYNVSSESWASTLSSPAVTPRFLQAATFYKGVYYIFAGGIPGVVDTDDIVEYDLAADKWTVSDSKMPKPIDGGVAVHAPAQNKIFVWGGNYEANMYKYAPGELIVCCTPVVTPAALESTTAGVPVGTLYPNGALLPNGNILYLFGRTSAAVNTATLRVYNPATNTWLANLATTGTVPTSRYASCSATSLDGTKVAVFGGNNGVRTNEFFILDLNTNVWTKYASTGIADRTLCGLTFTENSILLYGGRGTTIADLADLWSFSLTTLSWTQLLPTGAAPLGRSGLSAFYSNGVAYFFGGTNYATPRTWFSDIVRYDVASNAWLATITAPAEVTPRLTHAGALLNGVYYVLGGSASAGATASVVQFNLTTQAWSTGISLPKVVDGGVAVASPAQNAVFLWGGNYESVLYKYTGFKTDCVFPSSSTFETYNTVPASSTVAPSTVASTFTPASSTVEPSTVSSTFVPPSSTVEPSTVPSTFVPASSTVEPSTVSSTFVPASSTVEPSTVSSTYEETHSSTYAPATTAEPCTPTTVPESLTTLTGAPVGTLYPNGALLPNGNILYLFGRNSGNLNTATLRVYDPVNNAWLANLATTGSVPSSRYAACSASSPDGTKVAVFGGNNGTRSNDFYVLDLTTNVWTRYPSTGIAERTLCGLVYTESSIVLFGGRGTTIADLADLWSFSLTTLSWTKLTPTGTAPLGRSGPTAFYSNGVAHFFGGTNYVTPRTWFSDIVRYDVANNAWLSTITAPSTVVPRLTDSATLFNGVFYVFGGSIATSSTGSSDIVKYDVATQQWTVSSFVLPKGHDGGAAVASPATNSVYVWGGTAYDSNLYKLTVASVVACTVPSTFAPASSTVEPSTVASTFVPASSTVEPSTVPSTFVPASSTVEPSTVPSTFVPASSTVEPSTVPSTFVPASSTVEPSTVPSTFVPASSTVEPSTVPSTFVPASSTVEPSTVASTFVPPSSTFVPAESCTPTTVPETFTTLTGAPTGTLYPNGALLPNGNILYLFGRTAGAVNTATLRVYDPVNNAWLANLATTGSVPSTRYAACSATSPDGTKVAVFGGNNGTRSNDFFILDLTTNVWTRYPSTGIAERTLCGLAFTETSIVLFGGRGTTIVDLADLWSFSLTTLSWTQLTPSGAAPLGRSGPTAFYSNGVAHFFGGTNYVTPRTWFSDIVRYDVANNAWLSTITAPATIVPRMTVSSTLFNGVFYVFGGSTAAASSGTTPIYQYNVASQQWTVSNFVFPKAHDGGAAVGSPATNSVYVWGGVAYDSNLYKLTAASVVPCTVASTFTPASSTVEPSTVPSTFVPPSSSVEPSTVPSTFAPASSTVEPSTVPSTFVPASSTVEPSTVPSTFVPPSSTVEPSTVPSTFVPASSTVEPSTVASTFVPPSSTVEPSTVSSTYEETHSSTDTPASSVAEPVIVPESLTTLTGAPAGTLYPNGALLPNGNILYLFGRTAGAVNTATLRVYNPATSTWLANLATTGNVPTSRYASCSATSPDGTKVAVFGGNNGTRSNEFFILDLNTNVWTKYPSTGIADRTLCGLVFTESSIVLFGGRGTTIADLADLWSFSLTTLSWTQLTPSGAAPLGRSGPVAFYNNGVAHFFGGTNYVTPRTWFSDIVRYDVANNAWLTTVTAPSTIVPRMTVASAVLNGNFYVFGGATATASSGTTPVYKYNIASQQWAVTSVTLAKALDGGVAVASPAQNSVYVWGGIYDATLTKYTPSYQL